MRILAIETSGGGGGLAAVAEGELLAELTLPEDLRTAATLAPGIRDILRRVGWRPADVQLVATTIGPGSFTGLRLGVTTAKTFAYAVGADALGINTLDVIAVQSPADAPKVSAAIDAQRDEVFAAIYERGPGGGLEAVGPTRIVARAAWQKDTPSDTLLTGSALEKHVSELAGRSLSPRECWRPRAATVGLLAAQRHANGERGDLWALAPQYYRRSAAEEKWAQRHGGES